MKMRSIVVGGVSEDKVSVRRGFRGCMQVWPEARGPPSWLVQGPPALHVVPLVNLLVFRKRIIYLRASPAFTKPDSNLDPSSSRSLEFSPLYSPRHQVTVGHLHLCRHRVSRIRPWLLPPAHISCPWASHCRDINSLCSFTSQPPMPR